MIEEDNDVLTDCGIRTLEHLNTTENPIFDINASDIVATVIMKSDSLRDAFNELDWSNSSVVLTVSSHTPHFRLSTSGTGASCQVDYPQDSEVFESFECKTTQIFEYKMKLLQPCVKALSGALKTQIRLNAQGLLSFQHILKTDDGQQCFVDFFIVPMDVSDPDE
eukprot:TRINITY_DN3190_c1_g1_i1.p1 TRINITY_DN3190_c1_g1~~TRINITY_DN3190_c1_g1_i1.p1  ORF type:complete len:165 (+),score=30.91 TRINITY_DN3190_c1_g1_i1:463-957(+)